jgi:HEAT repeat protein
MHAVNNRITRFFEPLAILLSVCLLWIGSAAIVYPQDNSPQPAGRDDRLIAQLNSDEEEQRLDALVHLGALLTSFPGTIDNPTISAVANLLLRDSSPVVRALAARTLELGNDERAVPHLLAAIEKERQVPVRKAIAYALARYPSPPVTTALISLLKDKKHEVRAAAAYALAQSGDPLATNALIEVLEKRRKDEDSFARSMAARGLGKIASREAIEPLLRSLNHDKSDDVRREAAGALGSIATKQDIKVIEALQQAALSPDPYLTDAADNALLDIDLRTR